MLLTFSKDRFVDAIKTGQKIHTIREDKPMRWKPGMKIHFWRGNPRTTKSNPFPFGESQCVSIQEVFVKRVESTLMTHGMAVLINNRWLQDSEIEELATKDGLTIREFRMWFVPPETPEFTGRIIHWTDKKY